MKPLPGIGQPPEVREVIQLRPPSGAAEQVDLPGAGGRIPHSLLDDRLDWGQPGTAGHAQQIAVSGGRQRHRAERGSEREHLARPRVVNQRVADPPARYRLDVQLDEAVVARAARDRVRPPHPRPTRGLYRDVLAGLERQRLVGRDREHGDAPVALVIRYHLARPPGWRQRAGILRRLDHQRRDGPVCLCPRLLGGWGEGRPGERPQRGEQRVPDGLVHRRFHTVLAVVPAQLSEVGGHLRGGGQALHDPDQRLHQPVPLIVHGRREHVT